MPTEENENIEKLPGGVGSVQSVFETKVTSHLGKYYPYGHASSNGIVVFIFQSFLENYTITIPEVTSFKNFPDLLE